MGKTVQLLILLVVLSAGASASVVFWLGHQTPAQMDAALKALSRPGTFILRQGDYQRGFLKSQAVTVVSVEDPSILATYDASRQQRGLPPTPLEFRIRHVIHHTPLAKTDHGWDLRLATVESDLQMPDPTQNQLRSLFGEQPPLEMHTIVHMDGSSETRLQVPAARIAGGDGEMAWEGLSGEIHAPAALDRFKLTMRAPGYTMGGRVPVRMESFSVNGDYSQGEHGLWFGTTELRLGRLRVENTQQPGEIFTLEQLSAATTNRANGDTAELGTDFILQQAAFAGKQAGPARFGARLKNIDLISLARLRTEMERAATADTPAEAYRAHMAGVLMDMMPAMLGRSPELHLTPLEFSTPAGNLSASIVARFAGGDGIQWSSEPPPALLNRVGIEGKFRINRDLAKLVMAMQLREQLAAEAAAQELSVEAEELNQRTAAAVSTQIRTLKEMQLLMEDGNDYVAEAIYLGGQLTINGQPADGLLN